MNSASNDRPSPLTGPEAGSGTAEPGVDGSRGAAGQATDREASGAPAGGPAAALRIGLIGLLVAAAGAFGLYEGRFLPGVKGFSPVFRSRAPSPQDLSAGFPLLPGDVALSREPVAINGREVDSLRCASERPPAELVRDYAESLRASGYEAVRDVRAGDVLGAGRIVPFTGKEQSMLGFKAPDGGFVGILAFANAETGGSDFFVVREGPGKPGEGEETEAPGNDPPGVAPPPASVREFCVERKGARPSFLVLYRSQAPRETVARMVRMRMSASGWTEPEGAAEAFEGASGGNHLLFRRGAEQCLMSLAPNGEDERECWVTVMYRKRP